MSLFHCFRFSLVIPLSYLSHRATSFVPVSSSVFSTLWADLFRTGFCSVVTRLVQASPGEFDPACKLKFTSCKNVAVLFFFYILTFMLLTGL